MNYLLDTHVLLWVIQEREKLSRTAIKAIENPQHNILVSAISFWEIALKFSAGKLKLQNVLPDEFPVMAIQNGFQLIAITPDECASYYGLPLANHKDPFYRMLIWQAIMRNLILISKDDRMITYSDAGLKVLW